MVIKRVRSFDIFSSCDQGREAVGSPLRLSNITQTLNHFSILDFDFNTVNFPLMIIKSRKLHFRNSFENSSFEYHLEEENASGTNVNRPNSIVIWQRRKCV